MRVPAEPGCPLEMEDHTWCDVCNGVIDGNDDDQPRILICWNCFCTVYSEDGGESYVCGGCGMTPEEWLIAPILFWTRRVVSEDRTSTR